MDREGGRDALICVCVLRERREDRPTRRKEIHDDMIHTSYTGILKTYNQDERHRR